MNQPIPNSVRRMTGGMALAEMLKLTHCGPMFGMGGFQLLPFYEACRALKLKHYLINDERCGAFAAPCHPGRKPFCQRASTVFALPGLRKSHDKAPCPHSSMCWRPRIRTAGQ